MGSASTRPERRGSCRGEAEASQAQLHHRAPSGLRLPRAPCTDVASDSKDRPLCSRHSAASSRTAPLPEAAQPPWWRCCPGKTRPSAGCGAGSAGSAGSGQPRGQPSLPTSTSPRAWPSPEGRPGRGARLRCREGQHAAWVPALCPNGGRSHRGQSAPERPHSAPHRIQWLTVPDSEANTGTPPRGQTRAPARMPPVQVSACDQLRTGQLPARNQACHKAT